ncbi:MAG: rpsB, partial [Frankiales bacterium]|nr:rpsB [Frankiales bacterium]
DTNKEHLAVNEARKLGIPVVAILDTNCDPDIVDYKIPGNDDAIRSIGVLTRVIADAVAEGLRARAGASAGDDKPEAAGTGAGEPLPEWEQQLLTGSNSEPGDPAPTSPAATAGASATEGTAPTGEVLQAPVADATGAAAAPQQ